MEGLGWRVQGGGCIVEGGGVEGGGFRMSGPTLDRRVRIPLTPRTPPAAALNTSLPTRWSMTLSSKVIFHHATAAGRYEVQMWSRNTSNFGPNETLVLH